MRLEARDVTTFEPDEERHRLRCGSPICAYDAESIRHCIWFPDEPICSELRVNEPGVARRMRRIAKVARTAVRPEPDEPGYPGLVDSFFTLADLRSLKRIDRRIRGRNPDGPRANDNAETTQEWRGVEPAGAILEVVP